MIYMKKLVHILLEKVLSQTFKLELTKFASKKAYLIQKNVGNKVVPLTSSQLPYGS